MELWLTGLLPGDSFDGELVDGSVNTEDLILLLAAFDQPSEQLHVFDGLDHTELVRTNDLLLLLEDFGTDLSGGCSDPVVGEAADLLDAVVTTSASSVQGYTTYRLTASLRGTARSLYSIEGTPEGTIELPAAYQVITPFGVDTAGANPQFFGFMAEAEYDSWLSIGITDGDHAGELSSIGIDFPSWTDSVGLTVDDGALLWMHPEAAPGGDVVVAQLTVASGSSGTVTMGMQGRSIQGADWDVHRVTFTYPPLSCSDMRSFQALIVPINVECCDEPGEDCSDGYPASCNAGCAALLLPFRAAGANILGGSLMAESRARLERAAQTCEQGSGVVACPAGAYVDSSKGGACTDGFLQ